MTEAYRIPLESVPGTNQYHTMRTKFLAKKQQQQIASDGIQTHALLSILWLQVLGTDYKWMISTCLSFKMQRILQIFTKILIKNMYISKTVQGLFFAHTSLMSNSFHKHSEIQMNIVKWFSVTSPGNGIFTLTKSFGNMPSCSFTLPIIHSASTLLSRMIRSPVLDYWIKNKIQCFNTKCKTL